VAMLWQDILRPMTVM